MSIVAIVVVIVVDGIHISSSVDDLVDIVICVCRGLLLSLLLLSLTS